MAHKKLMNLRIIIGFVIFLGLLIILARTFNNEIPIETGIIGTMYTFFYGLFINAIFKFLDEKYVHVRIFLGDLIGKTQSLYNLALLTENKIFIKNVREHLVKLLESFNHLRPEKYYENQHYIDDLFMDTKSLKVEKPKQVQQYSRIIQLMDHISITREKLEIFGKKHIKDETKFILISTTVLYLILIAVMTFTSISLYVNIVGVILVLMVVFVMILMFNLDNLSYGTYYIKTKNIDEIIEEIGGEVGADKKSKKEN
jgi:hypothetical protein